MTHRSRLGVLDGTRPSIMIATGLAVLVVWSVTCWWGAAGKTMSGTFLMFAVWPPAAGGVCLGMGLMALTIRRRIEQGAEA